MGRVAFGRMQRGLMADGAPISLYLDLVPGEKADLEVAARASLAFAEAIKAAAYFLEPGLQVKIELESGSEGNLSLNSILKRLKAPMGKTSHWLPSPVLSFCGLETTRSIGHPTMRWISSLASMIRSKSS